MEYSKIVNKLINITLFALVVFGILLASINPANAGTILSYECDTNKPIEVKKAMSNKLKQIRKAHKAGKVTAIKSFVPCTTFVTDDIVALILPEVPVVASKIPKYLENFSWVSQAKPKSYLIDNMTRTVAYGTAPLYKEECHNLYQYSDCVIRLISIPCLNCVSNTNTGIVVTPLPSSLWLFGFSLLIFIRKLL